MTSLRKRVAALTLALLSTLTAQLSTGFAQAAFVKIVAAGDAVPDRPPGTAFTGILGGSAAPPAISGDRVAFVAAESDGNTSLWTASTNGAGLARIADRSTPVSDSTGTLYDLNPFELAGGRVVFRGHAYAPDHAGHYSAPAGGGALIRLADENTLIPGTTNPFGTLPFDSGEFHCDATNYVFAPGNLGFILFVGATTNGLIRRFADSTTRIQETNYFDINEYGQPGISGRNIVPLVRGSGQAAICRLPLGGPVTNAGGYVLNATRVASKNTPVPGGPTNFHHAAFAAPAINGETVVFRGGWTTNGVDFTLGLYSWVNGTLHKLVDTATPSPGGSGNFAATSFQTFAMNGGDVVFLAADTQRQGIYRVAATGGGLRKILAVGDAFPFGTVAGNSGGFFQPPLQANSLDGGLLALRLDVTPPGGGSSASGIYVARLRQLLAPTLRIRLEGSDAVLSAETHPGAQYQLQRRASLAAGDWLNFGSPTNSNDGTIEWRDAGRLTRAAQFYRLVVTQ